MACSALLPRTRLYCTHCGEFVGTERITGLICGRKLGGCVSSTHSTAAHPKGTSYGDAEASPSGRSTQSAWKQCACARHARLNRVTRTIAKRQAQSTSEWPKTLPRGSNGGRSPLGLSFFHIFLQTKKDMAPGGRRNSREVGENVKSKILPSETVGCRARQVKT